MTTPLELSYRIIHLTKGQIALVDAADYDRVAAYKWQAVWSKTTKSFYARRSWMKDGIHHVEYMHRLIMGLTEGDRRQVDHRESGQTLDNRRGNLRVSTHSQQRCNARLMGNNTSGVKGVSLNKKSGKWVAYIQIDRKFTFLGAFVTKDAAIEARRSAANMLHGEFVNNA